MSAAGFRPAEFEELFGAIAAGAADRELDRVHPYEQVKAIKAERLGAVRLPVELGGRGWSMRDLIRFAVHLGAADPNLAHALRNHYTFVEGQLAGRDRSARWLAEVAAGELFSGATTELASQQVGAGQIATTLRRDGDGYRLSGRKYYSTGTLYADRVSVSAVDEDGQHVTVVVPTDRDGVLIDDDWDGIGQRLTGTGTTRLVDVRVEAGEILRVRDPATPRRPHQGGLSQLYLTAVVAGILRAAGTDAAALVRSRGTRNFVHGLAEAPADDPLLQAVIGEIDSAAFAAEAIVLAAADALDAYATDRTDANAHDQALQAARAKVAVDGIALQAAGLVFDVGGASATARTRNLDRHWRNARTLASHNPRVYKAQAVGAHAVAGRGLPTDSSFF